jgi:hypothetical protein
MRGGEEVVRKSCLLALTAVLAMGLGGPSMALAQLLSQGNQVYGTFGNQTLGQPFVPRRSTLVGGIQTGPSGNFLFLGRPDGSTAFAPMPWRHIDPGLLQEAADATRPGQSLLNAVPSAAAPVPVNNPPQVPAVPSAAPETSGLEGAGPAEQAPGINVGIGLTATPQAILPRVVESVESAPPRGPQPYVRSPELSDLLTRLARSKGVLSGNGIDVYLSNKAALVEGAVRTPGARVLLANILALEPEVTHIDNRLVAEGSGMLSSNRKSP